MIVMMFLAFVVLSVFLLGLFLWAQSGANLVEMFRIRRKENSLSERKREEAEEEIRQLGRKVDRTLSASFKIVGVLVLLLWLLVGVSMIIEFLGGRSWVGGLMNHISMKANTYWNSLSMEKTKQSTPERNNMLRNMGVNMRK